MERLTRSGFDYCAEHCASSADCGFFKHEVPIPCLDAEIYNRLAAYEDTELEPEEVEACKIALMGKSLAEIKEIEGIPVERMKVLAKAEAEGRLLVLPCKVGDTVYKVWYDPCHNGERYPGSDGCIGCEDDCDIKKSVHEIKAPSVDWILRQLHNGSFVYFLTREEAEAALKGAEEGEEDG